VVDAIKTLVDRLTDAGISLPNEEDKQDNESDEKQRTDYDADDECR